MIALAVSDWDGRIPFLRDGSAPVDEKVQESILVEINEGKPSPRESRMA